MKKRNFETKIITGLLTAGMILSLTACGSSSKGGYGISDLMDADYSVASNEAAAPEASAYEDGFGMTEGYDSAKMLRTQVIQCLRRLQPQQTGS